MKTDSQIQQDVTHELQWDAAIDSTDINVSVDNGLVTLEGQVNSYPEKWEAEKAVQRIAGVKALVVKLAVTPLDQRSDEDIARAAESALSWASYLAKDSIKIQVENGWLTLSGTVPWDYQRQNAARAVRYLTGVKGVSDEIKIQTDLPSTKIRADIEAALERGFDYKDQDIVIDVSGRNVTLSGTVTSWWQRDLARNAAWNAAGVQNVTDHMTIAY